MKKLLTFAVFCIFTSAAYCEQYIYKANTIDEIDIVISMGTLNVASAKTKDIIIDITPDKPENMQRHIKIDNDRNLKIYLDDAPVDEDTIVSISVPASKNDIEINSLSANVNVSNIKGALSIDTVNGNVSVKDFVGDFDIDTISAEVKAEGIFKNLDIESTNANVFVTMRLIPSFYDYSVEGVGNITLKLPSKFTKARLKLGKDEFYGTLDIQ